MSVISLGGQRNTYCLENKKSFLSEVLVKDTSDQPYFLRGNFGPKDESRQI